MAKCQHCGVDPVGAEAVHLMKAVLERGGKTPEQADEITEGLAVDRFIGEDGKPDAAAIEKFAAAFGAKAGGSSRRTRVTGQAGSAEAQRRFPVADHGNGQDDPAALNRRSKKAARRSTD